MSADVEWYTLPYLMPLRFFCKVLSCLNQLTFAQLENPSTEKTVRVYYEKIKFAF